jgi:DNA-binding IclR family transcriptional regulator
MLSSAGREVKKKRVAELPSVILWRRFPVPVKSKLPIKKTALDTPSIQSLDRGLFILEAVAKSGGPATLGRLTELLSIDRSSVFRLANTLKRRGFLAHPNGRKDYILGPSIWRLSRQCDWSKMLITVSEQHLRTLGIETGETAHLAIREGKQALFIDHFTSLNQIITVSGQTGEFVPLYCTAHGKALLADFNLAQLRALFGKTPLEGYTARTVTSVERLAKDCAKIKADGYALDDVEFQEEVRCLAAPVRDQDGTVIAAIGISAPLTRFSPERCLKSAPFVAEIAQRITAVLSAETQD